MGRIYYVTFENISITNANGDHDLWYIAPADDKPVRLWGYELSCSSNTDMGDAQEEQLRLEVIRGHSTVGSGGTAVTASTVGRANPTDPDPSFTARTCDTTIASAGTTTVQQAISVNNRVTYEKVWIPELTPWCTQVQSSIVVRLMAAVVDDITMSGTLSVEELG